MDYDQPITFNDDECADYVFTKLIERGIAVSVEDIKIIMSLEYEYGVSIGIYPSDEVKG